MNPAGIGQQQRWHCMAAPASLFRPQPKVDEPQHAGSGDPRPRDQPRQQVGSPAGPTGTQRTGPPGRALPLPPAVAWPARKMAQRPVRSLRRLMPAPDPGPKQPCSAFFPQSRVRFHMANATVSIESLLATYEGKVDWVLVQFPDPHFKASQGAGRGHGSGCGRGSGCRRGHRRLRWGRTG